MLPVCGGGPLRESFIPSAASIPRHAAGFGVLFSLCHPLHRRTHTHTPGAFPANALHSAKLSSRVAFQDRLICRPPPLKHSHDVGGILGILPALHHSNWARHGNPPPTPPPHSVGDRILRITLCHHLIHHTRPFHRHRLNPFNHISHSPWTTQCYPSKLARSFLIAVWIHILGRSPWSKRRTRRHCRRRIPSLRRYGGCIANKSKACPMLSGWKI